jgi:hypothetical protein
MPRGANPGMAVSRTEMGGRLSGTPKPRPGVASYVVNKFLSRRALSTVNVR